MLETDKIVGFYDEYQIKKKKKKIQAHPQATLIVKAIEDVPTFFQIK